MKHLARFRKKALRLHKQYSREARKAARRVAAHPHFHKALWLTAAVTVFASALYVSNNAMQVVAQTFQGPSGSAGTGSGALGLDANKNLSLGTSTPVADTKLLIVASSSQSAGFAVKVVQPGASTTNANDGLVPGTVLFMIRNDGKIGIGGPVGAATNTVVIGGNTAVSGTVSATGFTGGLTGTVSAGNVGSGLFGQYAGGANYQFPAALFTAGVMYVGTTTSPGGFSQGSGMIIWQNGTSTLRLSNALNSRSFELQAGGSDVHFYGINGSQDFVFSPSTVERMRIEGSTGDVGIGTTNPATRLSVSGGTSYTNIGELSGGTSYSGIAFGGSSAAVTTGGYSILGNGTHTMLNRPTGGDIYFRENNADQMIIKTGGNVGIGTTAPSSTLHLRDSGGGLTIDKSSTGGQEQIYFKEAGTNRSQFTSNFGDSKFYLYHQGDNRMVIDSSGNVGFGTTAPSSTVHAVGGAAMTGGWNRTAVLQATFPVLVFNSNSSKWGGIGYDYSVGGGVMRFWVNAGSYDVPTGTEVLSMTSTTLTSAASTFTVGGGTGKINAGTIDPIYTINGVNYATYVSGMTGVKEETSGVLELRCGSASCDAVLDIGGAPKGSDLWLFGKAIDWRKNLKEASVLLTPGFEGRVWYDKDIVTGRVHIHAARPAGGRGEVSYRLTAPRFDSETWSNYNNDPGAKGFIIND